MSDRHSHGSSRGSKPSPLEERTYLQPESTKTKEGYLDPYHFPSSHDAKRSPSTSTSSSNKSSKSSSKSAKRSNTKAAIIHHGQGAPEDQDHYDKTTDAGSYKNSFLDSGEPKNKDSMARKAYDPRYYPNSSYYQD